MQQICRKATQNFSYVRTETKISKSTTYFQNRPRFGAVFSKLINNAVNVIVFGVFAGLIEYYVARITHTM